MKGKIKELENSEIEITAEIDALLFASYRDKALKALNKDIAMDGFRAGHIPEEMIIQKLGEIGILEEAAEIALRELYPKFVIENNIDAIGRPEISITKIAKGNPLEVVIKTAVMPKFEVADYKKIAKKVWTELSKEKTEATEKEVETVIDEIRKSRVKKDEHTCVDEKCKEDHKGDKKEVELPEVTDDFVKTIGNFKDVADFKDKIKKNLELEKENAKRESGRTKILEKIAEDIKVKIPKVLVDNEVKQILSEMKGRVEQIGLEFDKYLEQIKKTEADIKKEAEEPAEKRVKFKLILKSIAKTEEIKVPEDEVMKEVENLLKYYEGADFTSAKMYVEDTMTNDKVFELLDNQK
ncbi:MAG: trigger factor [bacterium]